MTEQTPGDTATGTGTPVAVIFSASGGLAGLVRVVEDPAQDLAEQAAVQLDREENVSDDSYEHTHEGSEAAYHVFDLSGLNARDLARVWRIESPDDLQEIVDLVDAKARFAGMVRAISPDAEAA